MNPHVLTDPSSTTEAPSSERLLQRLLECRQRTMALTETLSSEDQVVQVAPYASPTKWHLAHTTWFFENFLLKRFLIDYEEFSKDFSYCFNSYYETVGDRQPQSARGLMTRPALSQVVAYREYVDTAMIGFLQTHSLQNLERLNSELTCCESNDSDGRSELDTDTESTDASASTGMASISQLTPTQLIELGIQHEQQHQELILTDILALFANQPLRPAFIKKNENRTSQNSCQSTDPQMVQFSGGLVAIGYDEEVINEYDKAISDSRSEFCFDNELPRHRVWLHPFRICDRLVTNHQWLSFIEDGGYQQSSLWLSEGWEWLRSNKIQAPGYWEKHDGQWLQMTLAGLTPIVANQPVCHLSHFEADAFAKWQGKRLPTEFEWEFALNQSPEMATHSSRAPERCHPESAGISRPKVLQQMFGQLWQWTQSAYLPYPGYKAPPGAVGEYNGKFMSSQMVLRGSSFATAPKHQRSTYRNFFYPDQRWQFTGMRLAEDVK